ncbi:MAG: neutral/alkaline non-lysosomal ceramidase N-terminal domain-containing protein [Clostridia bacterium]|nr:neutral/alkaline non-lysosomal ceramidase N-terminal domain-containing protein [Clostridia bacterium]
MKAGLTEVIITPPLGVALGGNGREDNKAKGVHDDLQANVVILDNEGQKVAFIGLDLLAIFGEDCDAIKTRVEKATGIKKENITINATHTHSGPNVVKAFMNDKKEIEDIDNYRADLIDKVSKTVIEANENMFDCKIGFGKVEEPDYSFNRRIILKDGSFKMVFEDYDPDDIERIVGPETFPDLNIFKITDKDCNIKGVMVNYTSHLTALCGEGLLYSRDFVHYFTESLKSKYGKDIVVFYANGAQGNLTSYDTKKEFNPCFEEAERVGNGLAKTAIRLIDQIEVEDELKIKTIYRKIKLPLREITQEMIDQAEETLKKASGPISAHGLDPKIGAGEVLKLANIGKEYEETVIQAVQLGDCAIVTFPGEAFVEYGIQVIDNSPFKNTIIFGLANDYIGYVPTEEAFSQGGYEIKTATTSRLDPKAGTALVKEANKLLKDLAEL